MNTKVDEIIYKVLKKEFGYKGECPDIYEAQNFFKNKHNLDVSAVKCCGPTDLSEHWNCFVEQIIHNKYGECKRIVFQDSWSLDFDYVEVINLCFLYYFIWKGFIKRN